MFALARLVHLAPDRCPHLRYRTHTEKEHYSTVVFSVCASHTKKTFSATNAFPGSCSDKPLVRYDDTIRALKECSK